MEHCMRSTRPLRAAAGFYLGVMVFGLLLSTLGCGNSTSSSTATSGGSTNPEVQPEVRPTRKRPRTAAKKAAADPQLPPLSEALRASSDDGHGDRDDLPAAPDVAPHPRQEQRTSLGDLLGEQPTHTFQEIDDQHLAAAGIRKIEGEYLTLYTDLPPQSEVDELPRVFDLAVGQWADYFHLDQKKWNDWRMIGFLMQEENRFRGAGVRPAYVPSFTTGYNHGKRLWLFEQPSAYYRRHLLLHEGVHGFMHTLLGNVGPPWYAEGIAERLATHRWRDGELQTSYVPRDKKETPMWGRVKIVRDAYAANRAMRLDRVMHYGPQAHLQVEPYGWCWTAAMFFDQHPLSRDAFRKLGEKVNLPESAFASEFRAALNGAWPRLIEDWQILVADFDYGYDVRRASVVHAESVAQVGETGVACTIQSDRGWQSSGYLLRAGESYRISAQGRYSLGKMTVKHVVKQKGGDLQEPKTWWCEPGGVTVRYHRGAPLGILTISLRPPHELSANDVSALLQDKVIGLQQALRPNRDGVLYLRINEAAAGLHDNEGELQIMIEKL